MSAMHKAKFLFIGADSHLAYHLIRQVNIKYSAKNVLAVDLKPAPFRSLGCDYIGGFDALNKENVRVDRE